MKIGNLSPTERTAAEVLYTVANPLYFTTGAVCDGIHNARRESSGLVSGIKDSAADVAGVALQAIKELNKKVELLENKIK